MAARRDRSEASWESLSKGNRRRWRGAFGGEDSAREAYLRGASLTSAQRGHAFTPNSPTAALDAPWLYPRYVGTHTDQLNELARQQGLAQHGAGPRGHEVTSYEEAGRDFTWMVPDGVLNLTDWRFSTVFQSPEEAQLFARRSWAPAGVVMIVDRGPGVVWRYEVWFGYPESRGKSYRGRGGRMHRPQVQREENIARIRSDYEGKGGRRGFSAEELR